MRREIYTAAEIRRVIAVCGNRSVGPRDRLVILLLWWTGLRPQELVRLRPADVGAEDVRSPAQWRSASHRREIPIPEHRRDELQAAIATWNLQRQDVAQAESPLLCTAIGGPLDTGQLRHMLAKRSATAGLERPFNAQGLRNTYAAELAAEQIPVPEIQRRLGLARPEYVVGYLHRLENAS